MSPRLCARIFCRQPVSLPARSPMLLTPGKPGLLPARRRGACGALLRMAVGSVIFGLLVDTWLVDGLVTPLVVSSGSMAPALRGPCLQWHCAGCGSEFACGCESLPASGRPVVCPVCGAENDPAAGLPRAGQRVLIDRSAFLWRPPRRFEVVVAQVPDDPRTLCVKRVVGLPGEKVKIADGEIWNGGQIVRKSLSDQRALGVSLAPRLPGASDNSAANQWHDPTGHWRLFDGRYVHDAAPEDARRAAGAGLSVAHSSTVDWLAFHHAVSHCRGRSAESRIFDESPYDQSESRQLNIVSDMVLCAEVAADGDGEILLAASSRHDTFVVRMNLRASRGWLVHNERAVSHFDLPALGAQRPASLEWAVADHQVRLALRGRVLVEYRYQPTVADDAQGPRLAIGARDASVELGELQVFRDVYYTDRPGEAELARQLGADEYFLLGDNSAHSIDSRLWSPRGGISGMLIVGKAIGW
jgi:signal peptidase I